MEWSIMGARDTEKYRKCSIMGAADTEKYRNWLHNLPTPRQPAPPFYMNLTCSFISSVRSIDSSCSRVRGDAARDSARSSISLSCGDDTCNHRKEPTLMFSLSCVVTAPAIAGTCNHRKEPTLISFLLSWQHLLSQERAHTDVLSLLCGDGTCYHRKESTLVFSLSCVVKTPAITGKSPHWCSLSPVWWRHLQPQERTPTDKLSSVITTPAITGRNLHWRTLSPVWWRHLQSQKRTHTAKVSSVITTPAITGKSHTDISLSAFVKSEMQLIGNRDVHEAKKLTRQLYKINESHYIYIFISLPWVRGGR